TRAELERRLVERQPVEDACDAERLTELARARAERSLGLEPPPPTHRVEPGRRLYLARERRLGASLLRADEVEAPVDAVRAIDVGVAGRPEHRGGAGCPPPEAVARGIVLVVRLHLDDGPAHAADAEQRPAQLRW